MKSPHIELKYANYEIWTNKSYFWENKARKMPDLWVLQRVLKGSLFLKTKEGHTHIVRAGKAAIFRHDDETSYGKPGEEFELELEFVTVRGEVADRFFGTIRREFGSVLDLDVKGEASALLGRMVENFTNQGFRDNLESSDLSYRLLTAVLREQRGKAGVDDFVSQCRIRVVNQFFRPISVKALANELGVSREHLTREYSARFGKTPGEHLKRLRMRRAVEILESTRLDVESVALACGYTSANSFCRAFKSMNGVNPGEFRKKN